MTLRKTTASILAITLLSTFALAYFPLTATAQVTKLVWLTHWTEPGEVAYWDAVIAKYQELHPDIIIQRDQVEFEALYQTIMMRHAAGEDPDIIHQHAMWIPTFANWRTNILSVPPTAPIDIQQFVKDNWTPATVNGSTYKDIVWGTPTEFNSWALVYNKVVIQNRINELTGDDRTFLQGVYDKLEADDPLSWDLTETSELVRAAKLLTKWEAGRITQTGFCPFVEGMPEEQRFQFLSMLYSNGGEYVDLSVPEALFDSTSGYQIMQLYHDLGYVIDTNTTQAGLQTVYNPMNIPDYWWQAWVDETIGLIILPTWMTYVRDAMGDKFSHLGIAPIPIGPSGTESRSMTYNWVNTVTQRAANEGRAQAAWNFLYWLNTPKDKESINVAGPKPGLRPIGDQVSYMGDYLIYDSIVPSRTDDLNNGLVEPGVPLKGPGADFWFDQFIMFGENYGKGDLSFLKGEQAQYQIGLMFEGVTTVAKNPTTAVDEAAHAIGDLASPNPDILTMAGDVTLNGIVREDDAVWVMLDWGATPTSPKWNRGRSEILEDTPPAVNAGDATILAKNFGKVGGSI